MVKKYVEENRHKSRLVKKKMIRISNVTLTSFKFHEKKQEFLSLLWEM